MKKLILLLSILILGCQTNTQQNNNKWTFDATDGSYIQWNGDDTNANEMLHHAMKHMYNVEREKSMTFFEKVLEYALTRLFLIKNQISVFVITKANYLYSVSFILYILS